MRGRNLILSLAAVSFLIIAALFFQKFQAGSEWLWFISRGGELLFPLVLVSAVIDSINPCAFSILIVSIIFLFGIGKARERVFAYGFSYILGIFVVYLLIGLGLLQVLHIFDVPHFMSKVGVALLLVFGLINILETVFPNFPIKFAVPHSVHGRMNQLVEKVSLPAMFLLGALVGICEFPCTGGPYLMVLGLLHDTATYWSGIGYLLLYNVVFVLPLAIILFIASNKIVVEKVELFQQSNKRGMKIIGGFLMILLAFIILLL